MMNTNAKAWTAKLRRLCVLVCAVSAVACGSDSGPARTVVIIDADDDIRSHAKKLRVKVERDDEERYGEPVDDPSWPQRFVMQPLGGDASRRFSVLAEALDEDEKVLGSARLSTGFVAGQVRYASLLLKRCEIERETPASELARREPSSPTLVCPSSTSPQEMAGAGGAREPDEKPDEPPGDAGAGTDEPDPAGRGGAAGKSDAGTGGKGGAGAGGRTSPPDTTYTGGRGGAASQAGREAAGHGGAAGMEAPKPMCGDGFVTGDELCDVAIAAGQPGACPTACAAADGCKIESLIPDACRTRCELTVIQTAKSGDGCCPERANAVTDSDCSARCGNGAIEPGETCDPPESCTAETICRGLGKCLKPVLSGDPNKCTAKCDAEPVRACSAGDGCCPASCNYTNDSDCSSECGDGIVNEPLETCEPTSASKPCPTSCDDGKACTIDALSGAASTCNAACTHTVITLLVPSDGCCPEGANALTDNDCKPVCGNGVTEGAEQCDAKCPASDADCNDKNPCTLDRLVGTGCDRRCEHTPLGPSKAADSCCPQGLTSASDADCPDQNLLAGKVFKSDLPDSDEQTDVGPAKMTDGDDLNTRWISTAKSPVHLTVDLGATYTLTRIQIVWAGDTIRRYQLQISNDGMEPWTTFIEGETGEMMREPRVYSTATVKQPPTGRFFQITGLDRWNEKYGNSIYEVRLYGTRVP